MKPLSEVLNTTKLIAEQSTSNVNTSNTDPHGLIIDVGKMNTLYPSSKKMATRIIESVRPLYEGLPLQADIEGQKKLTLLLVDCFASLNTFGKTPEQFEGIIRIFQLILGKYSYKIIHQAFIKYLENNSEMPTPANIIKIIVPADVDYKKLEDEVNARLG